MRRLLTLTVLAGLLATPWAADARSAPRADDAPQVLEFVSTSPDLHIAQGGCMSLSQAIDSVCRGGNVERIISAETKGSGGRQVHHIKVLTKDGKVKTHRIQGC